MLVFNVQEAKNGIAEEDLLNNIYSQLHSNIMGLFETLNSPFFNTTNEN